jgi:hypothetical protein
MKYLIKITIIALLFCGTLTAQESTMGPTFVTDAIYLGEVPSIASRMSQGTFIEAIDVAKEYNPKRRDANKAVPGKGLPVNGDPLIQTSTPEHRMPMNPPIVQWQAAAASATPTDPTGAVGPDHFVNAWNSSFRIWDKEGNALTASASLGNLWPGETSGDPVVMYDNFAERFVITQFTGGPNGFLFAVCQGPDPVNDGWYTYEFPCGSTFPDYPKYSVWSDGYYITSNKNSGTAGTSQVVYACDRTKMLVGDAAATMQGFPLPGIATSGFFSPLGFNANGNTLPPTGDAPIIYMQDDAWGGVATDHLKIWNINVNWTTPGSSTISAAQSIPTAPFDGLFDGGSFSNLPQPSGGDIDALQATIMYMAQYRRFGTHNSTVLNFVVDLNGADNLAGIRWYELRQANDGDPWTIYQEGTYAQPDGHSAFCGGISMDVSGNIGLAYTIVSSTQVPAIRYTGRYSTDPLGQMTLAEETIFDGTSSDPSTRYGDYAQMTIDPVDDKTFWHISEYFAGGRRNRVGAFKIASDLNNDVGVVAITAPGDGTLSATESITISVRNYGLDSQSNIPVSYSVDGGMAVNGVVPGPVDPNMNVLYTFLTTADLSAVGTTYSISATTLLLTDEDTNNDASSTSVTHLIPIDLGVTAITAPTSSPALGAAEAVTVTIENFGGATQTNFDVSYTVDGGAPVTEVVAGPLMGASSMSYTFTATVNMSALGAYEVAATTSIAGDANDSNDESSETVVKEICQPEQDCSFGDGFEVFELGTINNNSGCDVGGYGDYTNLSTDLFEGTTHDLTVTTGYGDQHVRVWVDFNDDFTFTNEEILISDEVIAPGSGGGTFTATLDLAIPSGVTYGSHMLRAKTNWQAAVSNDPCEESQYGETEDYTVNLGPVGLDENILGANDMLVTYLDGNHFMILFESSIINTPLTVSIHDIQGRKVIENWVRSNEGVYIYEFDMSYAATGAYLIRLGNEQAGKVKRFIVR